MIRPNWKISPTIKIIRWFALLAVLFCFHVFAGEAEPALTIRSGDQTRTLTRTQLWGHPRARNLEVRDNPAYPGKTMVYRAVPAWTVFEGVKMPDGATLEFKCLDGFSASIDRARLLSRSPDAAEAFIAIEPENPRWPEVKAGQTAGPFYLIWKNPQKSKIVGEEWPYQLVEFEVKLPVEAQFPQMLPDPALPKDHAARRGYQAFIKNCFACHTINRQGPSKIGPDLNVPRNPTEYLGEKLIRVVVRNPQNLRWWPESKMTGFTPERLPESDLSDIIAYLQHMVGRKAGGGPGGADGPNNMQ
jgi:mono/diheme cytochrome c family protein